ncbi:hypothetical protein CUMW_268080 [Citrus unshiu]|uniref:AAA+ ATPase domain-containing protein n=1 Tax=Citrus unshiu TaxID=55188 RepID=A0A2H5QWG4_CITUN|nr:hypothetical protein CUMW_268080 [Citrus unshiu]
MRRLAQVEGWLSRVQDVEGQVQELISESHEEVEKQCLAGLCSKNYLSSYMVGRRVFKTLQVVENLRGEGDFKDVAQHQPVPKNQVDERPVAPTVVGLESTLDKVWRSLMEEQVGIVGLYGMGGVGKTTLLTLINNKFLDSPNNFDFVVWIVVSKDLQLEKIQDGIAKKIGLFDGSWNGKKIEERADKIFKKMRNKKFVLLLDDIWEPIDLAHQVGLPVPRRKSTSTKIVFTTREFEVCGQMDAHKSFKLECLDYEDAWKLFEEKVGRDILDGHPDIPGLAETVTKECGGLPLAIITVGRAMASRKTPREWEHAIDVLRSSASKFSGMEKRVYSRLKFSYDFLPSEATRFCLLYCSLFSEDYSIRIEDLIDCLICEGLLDEYDGSRARNEGHSIIRTLVHACMLEEEEGNNVKMHDVIRDMALWIASTLDKEKEKFLVLAGVGLTEAPGIGMWTEVTRMSLMQNSIRNLRESPASPRLLTLFLTSNELENVNNDFFQSMASLRVLELSRNSRLPDLPLGIPSLVPLQRLDLSMTNIESLPIELRHLVNLKCLNLEHTRCLSRIPPQVISNLKMLRVLRLFGCGSEMRQKVDSILYGGREALVEELLGLEHLNVLTISLHSFRAFERFLSSPKLQNANIPSLVLKYCYSLNSLSVVSLASLKHLQTLHLTNIYWQEFQIDYSEEVKQIRESRGFHSLQKVYISGSKFRHVTWLILAPNLKHLQISCCKDLEEIINGEKMGQVPAEAMVNLNPFARLEYLILEGLENLKSICDSSALPFPHHLKKVSVQGCPKLKKPPQQRFGTLEE